MFTVGTNTHVHRGYKHTCSQWVKHTCSQWVQTHVFTVGTITHDHSGYKHVCSQWVKHTCSQWAQTRVFTVGTNTHMFTVGSVIQWLRNSAFDEENLGSKPVLNLGQVLFTPHCSNSLSCMNQLLENICTSSRRELIAAWLNASQRSQDGV